MIRLEVTTHNQHTIQFLDWCDLNAAILSLDPFQAAPRPTPQEIRTLLHEAAN